MGFIDASRKVADKALSNGRSLFICTGGEEESKKTKVGVDAVVLKNRKGFIRLAIKHNCSVVPVFGVGVSDLYKTYDLGSLKLRQRLQKYTGIAIPFFHGVWGSPTPYKVPINILIGEPIEMPKVVLDSKGSVDEKIVDEYHAKYIEALKKLYAENVEGRELVIY